MGWTWECEFRDDEVVFGLTAARSIRKWMAAEGRKRFYRNARRGDHCRIVIIRLRLWRTSDECADGVCRSEVVFLDASVTMSITEFHEVLGAEWPPSRNITGLVARDAVRRREKPSLGDRSYVPPVTV
jgi:hypothetical protein